MTPIKWIVRTVRRDDAIEAARREERERCAALCDAMAATMRELRGSMPDESTPFWHGKQAGFEVASDEIRDICTQAVEIATRRLVESGATSRARAELCGGERKWPETEQTALSWG